MVSFHCPDQILHCESVKTKVLCLYNGLQAFRSSELCFLSCPEMIHCPTHISWHLCSNSDRLLGKPLPILFDITVLTLPDDMHWLHEIKSDGHEAQGKTSSIWYFSKYPSVDFALLEFLSCFMMLLGTLSVCWQTVTFFHSENHSRWEKWRGWYIVSDTGRGEFYHFVFSECCLKPWY